MKDEEYRPLRDFLRDQLWVVLGSGTLLLAALLLFGRRSAGLATALAWAAACTGLYALAASVLLIRRKERLRRQSAELEESRQKVNRLEAAEREYRRRLDELSMLREVAYVVNLEEDFEILLEKVLDLVAGLMEPREMMITLVDEETRRLRPAARWAEGKTTFGSKVTASAIPNFRIEMFQSQSIVLKSYEEELHAVLPLRVSAEILGAMSLVFPLGAAASSERLQRDFHERYRVVLQEIARHISLAVKTRVLHTKAVVDGLTGLYTKRHFQEQMEAHVERAQRDGLTFCFIMMDIDHFKQVNDTYGHPTGDLVLVGVAKTVRSNLRKYDTAYRNGGEELAIILPGVDLDTAAQVAERIRRRVEETLFAGEEQEEVHVTISGGVAQFGRDIVDGERLVARADQCLYEAKRQGRNRVIIDGVS